MAERRFFLVKNAFVWYSDINGVPKALFGTLNTEVIILTYLFERMRTISYASNADILLIRDKRASCEQLHGHDYNEMIYIYEGEVLHNINNESYNLVPGSLVLLTSNDTHSFISTNMFSAVNICFTGHMNGSAYSHETPVAILDEQSRIEMETLLYLTEQELNIKDPISDRIAEHCIDWMLLLFQRNNTSLSKMDSSWNKLLCKISEDYSSITLEEAADIIGVSVSHFCRKFKKDFAMTFHNYLNEIRIHQAKNLLLYSEDSVSHIGERVGFQNACRFYSNFRKVTGMTPNEYRSAFKKNFHGSKVPLRSYIPEPTGVDPLIFSTHGDRDN